MGEFASKGLAGTALGFGIGGAALGLANGGLSRVLGGTGVVQQDTTAAMLGAAAALAANGRNGTCNEDHTVNRYEAQKDARIAELETEVKLRDANTYTDGKILEVYQYFDGQIKAVNQKLCDQAVWNATQTATIGCLGQQVAQLQGVMQNLTKVVIPNSSVCPGWGDVKVSIEQASASAT